MNTNATETPIDIATTTNASNINITTVESLCRGARRRGFNIHGGFNPPQLIPMVEARIQQHNAANQSFIETSGEYIEWKQKMDDLQQFLAILRSLPDRLPYEPKNTVANPAPTDSPATTAFTKKIEHLNKQIEERIAKLPEALRQQVTCVPDPSDQASDTRPAPVPNPSQDAPNASEVASGRTGAPPDASPSEVGTTDVCQSGSDPVAPGVSPDASPTLQPPATQLVVQSREEYILLHEHPSKSPIDDFPPERQQILYALLHERPYLFVAKMIAQPEPVGWNFKTSDTSLKRFKKRYRKKLEDAERDQAFKDARHLLAQTAADEQTYMDAARRLLKIRLFKNAADPEGSDNQIELIMSLLDRQRRTDLAERRVRVAEKRTTQK